MVLGVDFSHKTSLKTRPLLAGASDSSGLSPWAFHRFDTIALATARGYRRMSAKACYDQET